MTKIDSSSKKFSSLKNINDIRNISETNLRLKSFKEQIRSDDFSPIKTIKVDLSQHSQVMLLVLNDLHIGSPGCNIDKIIRYLKEVKYIPNCYIILNGDLMNNANNLGKSSPLENDLSPMNEQKVIHTLLSDCCAFFVYFLFDFRKACTPSVIYSNEECDYSW